MHESILPRVARKKETKEERDTSETAYQGLEKVKSSRLQIIIIEFESLLMKYTK